MINAALAHGEIPKKIRAIPNNILIRDLKSLPTSFMPTEKIISFCEEKGIDSGINPLKFEAAYNYASDIFLNYR